MTNRLFQVVLFVPALTGLLLVTATTRLNGQEKIDFGRDIRPILSDKCFACHGPDAQTRESGFRLDVKKAAFGKSDSGLTPIIPGKPGNSELVRRIVAHDDDQMPPLESEKQLKPGEIESLKRWIAEGANWSEHWAFIAPSQQALPHVKSTESISNPIDRFVVARLESKGLRSSEMATPETLIRRVSFDLTGLPPTLDEVDQFLARCENDGSEKAYEALVDQLLASPHYGEQMTADWLDAARFADSNGYQNDFGRDMWPWRDWVIKAFNENQPFDQFTVEQIAGDMLPNATDSQIIATGFNRNHRSVTEGGSIEEEWRVENIVDRVETTATTFLGLTMGCARCHDHKYDPISQREFYQFFAYFNSIDEKGFHAEKRGNVPPLMMVHSAEHKQKLDQVDKQLELLHAKIGAFEKKLALTMPTWREDFIKLKQTSIRTDAKLVVATGDENDAAKDSKQVAPTLLGPAISFDRNDKKHLVVDNDFEFNGEKPFAVSTWVNPNKDGAIISRMDLANDYRGFDMLIVSGGQLEIHLIHKWPVNAIKITTQPALPLGEWTHICVTYDGSQKSSGVKVYFNHRLVNKTVNEDSLDGTILTQHPLWIGLRVATPPMAGQVASLYVFDHLISDADRMELFEARLRPVVEMPVSKQNDRQKQLNTIAFQASFGEEYFQMQNRIAELNLERKSIEQNTPTTMILKELANPRDTFVLNRGQYDQPDLNKKVEPGIAQFLPQPTPELPKNRLGLARWMVDSNNPLTSRVAVNRFWQRYFGTGLLETPENFGVQSPAPLQQDLLDWLAVHFVKSGWDVKAFQKLIVMSSTYRQSSYTSPEAYQSDPKNALLGRGPRFRLSSESIRDNSLSMAGLLNRKIGGPSVKPYQPDGLWKELAGGASQGPYVQDDNDNIYRRSLYIYRKRTVPPPAMTTFDAGSREICQVARPRTNTPLQALALLNDITYVESSRRLAEISISQTENVDQQIRFAFRSATARYPGGIELKVLRTSYGKFLASFESSPESASQYLQIGDSKTDPTINQSRLAAMSIVCSMIFNLDETITKE